MGTDKQTIECVGRIRKATADDIDAIASIYEKIHDLDESGKIHVGWRRGIYPTRQTAVDAIQRNDMYVCEEEDNVVACAIINNKQLPVYYEANWHTEVADDKVLVLHTLVVAPDVSSHGIGGCFVEYYEQLAREGGYEALRIDTQELNVVARRMYKKLGFEEVDIIVTDSFNGLPPINLVLLEKVIH